MSYFAVRCLSGKEMDVLEILHSFTPEDIYEEIKSVVCPTAVIQKKKGTISRNMSFSYLYLHLRNATFLPPRVYHFINEIPYIRQILNQSIPEKEVEDYCNFVGASLEEAIFEIEVKKVKQNKRAGLLLAVNNKKLSEVERNNAQLELTKEIANPSDPSATTVHYIEQGKKKGIPSFEKITYKETRKKFIFRFPMTIIQKTIDRADPKHQRFTDKETLFSNEFMVEVNKTLLKELVIREGASKTQRKNRAL